VHLTSESLRILDFDCEARPLGWFAGDDTHKEITVIAWAWIGEDDYEVHALTKDDRSRARMLRAFRRAFDEADMVVGHYIRGFDLPLVNAMMLELGEPSLGKKLSHDTKNDLKKLHGISKSQENLSAMFELDEEKIHMTVPMWRDANRLSKTGIEGGKRRAVFDVAQNIALRAALLEQRLLDVPKVWRP
jgi:hypothetical protein